MCFKAGKAHAQLERFRLDAKLTRERSHSIASATSDGSGEGSPRSPTPEDTLDGANPFCDVVSAEAQPLLTRLLKFAPSAEQDGLSEGDFMQWMQKEKSGQNLPELLGTIGHLVFGIKPIKGKEEGRIIRLRQSLDAIDDKTRRDAGVSRELHLVSSAWWQEWTAYTTGTPLAKGAQKKSKSGRPASATRKHGAQAPQAPGEIRNQPLARPSGTLASWNIFSSSGGWTNRLRKNLTHGKDYALVSEGTWALLSHWYGGGPAYSRPLITNEKTQKSEVELYPLALKVLKHVPPSSKQGGDTNKSDTAPKPVPFIDYECSRSQTVDHVYRNIAKHKRVRKKVDSIRLWDYRSPKAPAQMDDKTLTLDRMGIDDGDQIVLEIRNEDLSWPSELLAVANAKKGKAAVETRMGSVVSARQPGATGLSNLGNTCYMNAALQCLSNTHILTEYFQQKCHLAEINKLNPIGTKGAVARSYGNLIRDLWRGSVSVAPSRLLDTIAHHAPQFRGNIQHDSQELLGFVIDGLHEDLNRILNKPYVERKDSEGRPDCVVAKESWAGYQARDSSIMVDLFHGLIKSQLRCKTCKFSNVTFDPFSTLTLPLPTENTAVMDVLFCPLLDDVPPTQLSVEVDRDATFLDVKAALAPLVGIPVDHITFLENLGSKSQKILDDGSKLRERTSNSHTLSAYEIASPLPVEEQTDGTGSDMPPGDDEAGTGADPSDAQAPMAVQSPRLSRGSSERAVTKGESTGSASKPKRALAFTGAPPRQTLVQVKNLATLLPGYLVVVHRRQDPHVHFLTNATNIQVFGDALLVNKEQVVTGADLYAFIWARVSRFIYSYSPPDPDNVPFVLKLVDNTGTACSRCHWNRFCTGCPLGREDIQLPGDIASIAIEWNAEKLHLSFDYAEQRRVTQHKSVQESKEKAKQPILLKDCLKAFTKEEDMGSDNPWYCPKCKEHKEATKKLDIWTLPPVLIIHLKRFHNVNGRWVKSQRHVDAPLVGLDVFQYLTSPEFIETPPQTVDPLDGSDTGSGAVADEAEAEAPSGNVEPEGGAAVEVAIAGTGTGADRADTGAELAAGASGRQLSTAEPATSATATATATPTPTADPATPTTSQSEAATLSLSADTPAPADLPATAAGDAGAGGDAKDPAFVEVEATETVGRASMALEPDSDEEGSAPPAVHCAMATATPLADGASEVVGASATTANSEGGMAADGGGTIDEEATTATGSEEATSSGAVNEDVTSRRRTTPIDWANLDPHAVR